MFQKRYLYDIINRVVIVWYFNKNEDVQVVKKDFEKYMKIVADAAKNVAETSKKHTIVETYKSLDTMLKNACFTCHETARPKWPEWPEWMKIRGV
mgnify:FL=1